MQRLRHQLEATAGPGSRARATAFETLHGTVRTPTFMPVGTQAAVRVQPVADLRAQGAQVLLANTYHLLLRPGLEVFDRFGGIHRFMGWDGPVLTDSGGYQIFSLGERRVMNEDGAEFTSHLDGRRILLSPERSIEAQRRIGSDIMMVLDQCIPSTAGREEAEAAMALTHRWARRSLRARGDSAQALFGIVQGACYPDLRRRSAAEITGLELDGFAIGGLAVGESRAEREECVEITAELLPADRPRYLMGVGTPIDLLEAVHRGVDLFDCILPTAFAQQGAAFTSIGRLDLRRGAYRLSDEPLDRACPCPTCRSHPRGYLQHLIKAKEPLGWQLLGAHNLTFYHRLMADARQAILAGRFLELYRDTRERIDRADPENPPAPPRPKRRPARSLELGAFAVRENPAGGSSVAHLASGEVMHSALAPDEEARALYAEQAGLRDALSGRPEAEGELVIWDVGLGAGHNAMAAIRALLEKPACEGDGTALILSFERDLDALRLALRHPGRFPHVRHPAPGSLLARGGWVSPCGRVSWRLLEGDFRETLRQAPAPEVVFFDPFSQKTDSELWTPEVFSAIRERAHGRPCRLYTYSASTAIRAALLASGFSVAAGRSSGSRPETTIAATSEAKERDRSRLRWLDRAWLGRWERSDARFPRGLDPACLDELASRVRGHEQFAARGPDA